MPLVAKSLAGSQVSAHCRASHKLYTLAGVSARWQEAGGLPYAHASHLADRAWEVTLQSRSSGFRFYLEILEASSPLPSRPALGMGKPRPPAHNRLASLPSFLPPRHEGVGCILPLPCRARSSPCYIFFPQEVTATPPLHLGCCQVLGEKGWSKGRGTFLLILTSKDIVSITLQIVIRTLKETKTQNNTGDRL